jgi:hypothetical protein
VRWHEEQRLKSWAQQEAASKKASTATAPKTSPPAVTPHAEALLPVTYSPPLTPSDQASTVPQRQPVQQETEQPAATAQPPAEDTGAVLTSDTPAQVEELPGAAAVEFERDQAPTEHDRAEASQQDPLQRAGSETALGRDRAAGPSGAGDAVSMAQLIGSAAGIVDLAATLTRPQRPPAKPLPPVPRFDRCAPLQIDPSASTMYSLNLNLN